MSAIRLITAMILLKQRATGMPSQELKEAFESFISGTGKRALLPFKVEICISMVRSQQGNT